MDAIILVRSQLAHKTETGVLSLVQNARNPHPDHMTIIHLMRSLRDFGHNLTLVDSKQLRELHFNPSTLLIVPQGMFVTGKLRNIREVLQDVERATRSGCDILLLHHHLDEFTDHFGLRFADVPKGYFPSKISSLRLNQDEPLLIAGVEEFWESHPSIKDEFTYLNSNGHQRFIPVVEKLPVTAKEPKLNQVPFLTLAYKPYDAGNSVFLVDVHATGMKKSRNADFFRILLNNVLTYINHKPFSTEIENKIIKDIETSSLSQTEKRALIQSRLGQGLFRSRLIEYWSGCAINKIRNPDLLRASHIKPWSVSTNNERLDPYNGILLSPNFDQVFDRGYISFNDEGEILISGALNPTERQALGISSEIKISLTAKHTKYLQYHRNHVFKK